MRNFSQASAHARWLHPAGQLLGSLPYATSHVKQLHVIADWWRHWTGTTIRTLMTTLTTAQWRQSFSARAKRYAVPASPSIALFCCFHNQPNLCPRNCIIVHIRVCRVALQVWDVHVGICVRDGGARLFKFASAACSMYSSAANSCSSTRLDKLVTSADAVETRQV